MKVRKFLLIAVAPMLLIGGGTALAASNAPGSGSQAPLAHPRSVARVAGEGLAPIELRHLQNPPETPAPTPSPSPAATQPLAPAPTSSPASPSHTSAPAPKPRPTPIVIVPPPPTPAPTPAGPIDSGTLPNLPFTIDVGGKDSTFVGTSYNQTFGGCPTNVNCLPNVEFSTLAWGNYDLVLTYKVVMTSYVGQGFTNTLTSSGTIPGWGPSTGTGGLVGAGSGNESVTLTFSIAWGSPPS